jgi:hypothetical protein
METVFLIILAGAGLFIGAVILIFLALFFLLAISTLWAAGRGIQAITAKGKQSRRDRNAPGAHRKNQSAPADHAASPNWDWMTPEELAIDLLRAARYA